MGICIGCATDKQREEWTLPGFGRLTKIYRNSIIPNTKHYYFLAIQIDSIQHNKNKNENVHKERRNDKKNKDTKYKII